MKKTLILLFLVFIQFGCSKDEPIITLISFDSESLTLQIGNSSTLRVNHTPSDLITPVYSWQSSDNSVVEVTQSGKISALTSGVATITATTEAGLTASCLITVLPTEAVSVKLSKNDLSLDIITVR